MRDNRRTFLASLVAAFAWLLGWKPKEQPTRLMGKTKKAIMVRCHGLVTIDSDHGLATIQATSPFNIAAGKWIFIERSNDTRGVPTWFITSAEV